MDMPAAFGLNSKLGFLSAKLCPKIYGIYYLRELGLPIPTAWIVTNWTPKSIKETEGFIRSQPGSFISLRTEKPGGLLGSPSEPEILKTKAFNKIQEYLDLGFWVIVQPRIALTDNLCAFNLGLEKQRMVLETVGGYPFDNRDLSKRGIVHERYLWENEKLKEHFIVDNSEFQEDLVKKWKEKLAKGKKKEDKLTQFCPIDKETLKGISVDAEHCLKSKRFWRDFPQGAILGASVLKKSSGYGKVYWDIFRFR